MNRIERRQFLLSALMVACAATGALAAGSSSGTSNERTTSPALAPRWVQARVNRWERYFLMVLHKRDFMTLHVTSDHEFIRKMAAGEIKPPELTIRDWRENDLGILGVDSGWLDVPNTETGLVADPGSRETRWIDMQSADEAGVKHPVKRGTDNQGYIDQAQGYLKDWAVPEAEIKIEALAGAKEAYDVRKKELRAADLQDQLEKMLKGLPKYRGD